MKLRTEAVLAVGVVGVALLLSGCKSDAEKYAEEQCSQDTWGLSYEGCLKEAEGNFEQQQAFEEGRPYNPEGAPQELVDKFCAEDPSLDEEAATHVYCP